MSIEARVTGRLESTPVHRIGGDGRPCVLVRVLAPTDDGGECRVFVAAFGSVGEQLAALAIGATVALTGNAKASTWRGVDGEACAGLAMAADTLLTTDNPNRAHLTLTGEREATCTQH